MKSKSGKIDTKDILSGVPWGKVYRTELFTKVSFPEGYWYEDSIMRQVIYPCATKIYGVDEMVYCWRNNPSGITRSSLGEKY